MKRYVIDIFNDPSALDDLISDVQHLNSRLQRKADEIARRLAEIGVQEAQFGFASAQYDGVYDAEVHLDRRGPGQYAVVADGESVLFIEFGAGITYNYNAAHPEAAENGMGPGTYNPASDAWMRPEGWWMDGPDGKVHTWGNPPEMPMYLAVKDLEAQLEQIAREVFADERY